ncbi:glutathione S-transferase family protein [Sphingosinithalassobacter portus]|uniref:glutathione S-transferase family protein n=1 Tax=Stakelama portus TaxID=2676234 RepID=UPI001961F41C|nr:glutathione S-transferase family protein [Sphingosinithalassobacter portus]
MTLQLFGHPFSSYSWKALIALYENDTPFDFRVLGPDQPENSAEFARRWPVRKFPLLVDGDTVVMESSAIVEYLQLHHPGPVQLIPHEPDTAFEVRKFDRIFDHSVMDAAQPVVNDALKPPERRDPEDVAQAKERTARIYPWLDAHLAGREWAVGDGFTLADIAAAPSLFYADWIEPIPESLGNLRAYRARLLARPSVSRCVEDARPFRAWFPPGAPDRD